MRILFLGLLLLCSMPARAGDMPWYNGGTQQKGTAQGWQAAAPADRLATAADFLAAFNGIGDISKLQPQDMEKFRKAAVVLEGCISQHAQSTSPETEAGTLALQCFMSAEKSPTGMPE
jgi:hypothetical protein